MSQSAAQRHTACGGVDESEGVPETASSLAEIPVEVIEDLLTLLCRHGSLDFRAYRRRMVAQRIARRMRLLKMSHVDTYVEHCQASAAEVQALGREVCSGATRFFRDSEAFEHLGNIVIPALIRQGVATGRIRIWVAGCATGEDAYSIAMLLREQCDGLDTAPDVKIFATDVEPQSLKIADRGLYAESRLADVSRERIKRFFHRHGDYFQVVRSLRDMVLFAPHNLLADPPLIKMDLIVCRNVLVYLEAPYHAQVIAPLQFALQPDGFLFLGRHESPGELQHLFQTLDVKWRIYQKVDSLWLVDPARISAERPALPLRREASQDAARQSGYHQRVVDCAVEDLLTTYCPPTLLVNEQHEILHLIGDAAPYMKQLPGIPSLSVWQLLHDDLHLPVRTVLRRLEQIPEEAVSQHALMRLADGRHDVTIRGRRQHDVTDRSDVMVLTFESAAWVEPVAPTESERLDALEQMLSHAQETLQGTIEDLEAGNAALQRGHEALLMANEELLATNAALHAVNGECQNKIVELTRLTQDMDNLLRSTEIGTILLDTDLCIRHFTPAIADAFHLLPRDLGRPIDHIASRLDDERLWQDATQVLRTGVPSVQQVRQGSARWMLRRLHPYHTEAGSCEGVVLTFVDVSDFKAAEAMLQQSEKRFRDLIEESLQGLLIYRSGRPLFVNRACARLFGYRDPQEMLALDDLVADIAAPHDYARLWHYTQRLLEDGAAPMQHEFQGRRQDGSIIWVECAMRCVMWEGACAVQATLVDVTERKRAEEALARKTLELQRSNDDLEQFAYVASHDLQEPLRLVSSYLYLLQDRCAGQLGADAEQFITFAIDGAGRMQRLIQELLSYARMGRQELVLKSIAGDSILDAALATLHVALKESGAKVRRERLPTMHVDPAQMELVFRHLISNSVKFRGRKRPLIDIRADFRGDAWLFSVRDNGIGIDPQDVGRLFTLFQCLHPRDVHTGAGIGLALCKRIIERHGGRIWVESQPGEGATFMFTLPA